MPELANKTVKESVRKPFRRTRTIAAVISLAAAIAIAAPARAQDAENTPDKRLQNSTASIEEVMNAPDKGIPRSLYNKARCVVIIPDVLKAAFIVGGKYGRGFVSCRRGPNGRFGTPAAIRIEGGSYGLQIGGSSTDVYMLIMNASGMKKLLSDKFTIGGEAEATAGPVGRDTSANTDILLHSEILTWSRSRGLFAGVSLQGATLRPDNSENEKLYGRKISNRRILSGEAATPEAAKPLVAELNRYRKVGSADVESSLTKKSRVTLTDVQFETGKADITPDSATALNAVLATLKDHADWNIRVEGFTDNVGSKEANEKLSADRAEAVANWLADHGIDRARLSSKGYGPARPVASNKSDDGRAKNRRVELVRV
jgi:SH3 domain-containing YSC84-like protein 1